MQPRHLLPSPSLAPIFTMGTPLHHADSPSRRDVPTDTKQFAGVQANCIRTVRCSRPQSCKLHVLNGNISQCYVSRHSISHTAATVIRSSIYAQLVLTPSCSHRIDNLRLRGFLCGSKSRSRNPPWFDTRCFLALAKRPVQKGCPARLKMFQQHSMQANLRNVL